MTQHIISTYDIGETDAHHICVHLFETNEYINLSDSEKLWFAFDFVDRISIKVPDDEILIVDDGTNLLAVFSFAQTIWRRVEDGVKISLSIDWPGNEQELRLLSKSRPRDDVGASGVPYNYSSCDGGCGSCGNH